jgi:hypothetical protein
MRCGPYVFPPNANSNRSTGPQHHIPMTAATDRSSPVAVKSRPGRVERRRSWRMAAVSVACRHRYGGSLLVSRAWSFMLMVMAHDELEDPGWVLGAPEAAQDDAAVPETTMHLFPGRPQFRRGRELEVGAVPSSRRAWGDQHEHG